MLFERPVSPLRRAHIAIVFLAGACVLSSGCGIFRVDTGYTKSEESRPIEVPPDLDTPVVDTSMQVPAVGPGAATARRSSGSSAVPLSTTTFIVNDSLPSTFARVGVALERLDGVEIDSKSTLLGTYGLKYLGESMLVRITDAGEETSRIAALASDGRASGTPNAAKLLGLLRVRLGAG